VNEHPIKTSKKPGSTWAARENPLQPAEYSTFAGPELQVFLLIARVEPMTFCRKLSGSFIAKTDDWLGHTYTFAEGRAT